MSFSMWLRSNSEHYLLQDAQARMAKRTGFPAPMRPKTLKDRFWRHVFAPTYRMLPRRLRRRTMQAIPGSHRRDWPKPDHTPRTPAV